MRRQIAVILVLLFLRQGCLAQDGQTLRVGAILPLSGGSSGEGEMARRGLEIARKRLEKLSSLKVQIDYGDSAADVKSAVSAYRNLRLQGSIPALITWGSGIGVALMPLVDQDRVVQIGIATSTPKYRVEGDYSFRLFPSAVQEGEFNGRFAFNELHAASAAMLVMNNDYGLGLAEAFRRSFEALGGRILATETVEASDVDFKTQILKIRTRKPELIFIASYSGAAVSLLRQARMLALSGSILVSSATVGDSGFLQQSGEVSDGIYVAIPGADLRRNRDEEVRQFAHLYRQAYNEETSPQVLMAARAHDALMLIAFRGAQNCPRLDGECLAQKIAELRDYSGAAGTVSFDSAGDALTTFNIQRVKAGSFIPF